MTDRTKPARNYDQVRAELTSIASNLRDYGPDVRDNIAAQLSRLADAIDCVGGEKVASDLVRGVAGLVQS